MLQFNFRRRFNIIQSYLSRQSGKHSIWIGEHYINVLHENHKLHYNSVHHIFWVESLTYKALMMVTVLVIECGAVHGMVVHGNDPRTLGSLWRLTGRLQVLLQPSILLCYQVQAVPKKEVEFCVYANDMSRSYVPAGEMASECVCVYVWEERERGRESKREHSYHR